MSTLTQPFRVNLVREPEWGGAGIPTDGSIEVGIDVPHEAANIQCQAVTGQRKDHDSGITYDLHCKKRAGHETPNGQEPHVPVDMRIVAHPPRVVHASRFAPNTIPAGVDLDITAPHDCANHIELDHGRN